MDAVDQLVLCDLIKILIQADYHVDTPFVPDGHFQTPQAQCIPKNEGELRFTFTPEEFGLPAFPFQAHLVGFRSGVDPKGQLLVTWRIDQNVGVYVPQADITVDDVHGQLTTVVSPVPAVQSDPKCGGDCHQHVVQLAIFGNDNKLTIHVHRSILGVDWHATATVSNIGMFATAAQRSLGDLKIFLIRDECGIGAVVGGTARFLSVLSGVPSTSPTYRWEISGGTIVGPADGTSLEVSLPAQQQDCTVTLKVTVGACEISRRLVVQPLSLFAAALGEYMCKHFVPTFPTLPRLKIDWAVNPLGPDVRRLMDLAARAFRFASDFFSNLGR